MRGAGGAFDRTVEADIRAFETEYGTGPLSEADALRISQEFEGNFTLTPEGRAARGVMDNWASTSQGNGGLIMQDWAAHRFGFRGEVWNRDIETGEIHRFSPREVRQFNDRKVYGFGTGSGLYGGAGNPVTRENAFRGLDRQYAFTQYMLGRQGINEMTAYRGVGGRSIADTVRRIPGGGSLNASVTQNPTSSWSSRRETAVAFGDKMIGKGREGVVLQTRLPRNRILFTRDTAGTGTFRRGFSSEAEVVPINTGRIRVTAYRVRDISRIDKGKGKVTRGVTHLDVNLDSDRENADWLK
jgi:hypothetical protein